MTSPRKSGANSDRDPGGRFATGNPGKPRGARHRTTRAALALLDAEGEALTRKAIDLALEGDPTALRLCLERIAPRRKDAPVIFDVPEMRDASDAVTALGRIVEAMAAGELTPHEAASVANLVEAFRRALETQDLEARIHALEARDGKA